MSNSNAKIDEQLVIQIQSGHKELLATLVKRWHLSFCKKAYWLVKDEVVAKDIAQDSWQTIISKIESLKDPSQFKSWALRIVSNKSLDYLRFKTREQQHFNIYKKEFVVDEPYKENIKLKQNLLIAIKELPIGQQVVIRLFYTESQSLRQISETLNLSVGTVKSRLFHAREKLKRELNKNRRN